MYYPGIDFQTSISIGPYIAFTIMNTVLILLFLEKHMIFGSLFMQTKARLLLQVIKLNFG